MLHRDALLGILENYYSSYEILVVLLTWRLFLRKVGGRGRGGGLGYMSDVVIIQSIITQEGPASIKLAVLAV